MKIKESAYLPLGAGLPVGESFEKAIELKHALRPAHYQNASGTDLFGAMEEQFTPDEFAGFLKGNVWKYTQRYKQKNGVEDLEKAKVYLETLIEFEKGREA